MLVRESSMLKRPTPVGCSPEIRRAAAPPTGVQAEIPGLRPHAAEGSSLRPHDLPRGDAPCATQDLAVGGQGGGVAWPDATECAVDVGRSCACRRKDCEQRAQRPVARTLVQEARAVLSITRSAFMMGTVQSVYRVTDASPSEICTKVENTTKAQGCHPQLVDSTF